MDKEIKIGDKAYLINNKCDIEEFTILAIIQDQGNEPKYKLRAYSCEGLTRDKFYTSKGEAEKVLQDYLQTAKFMVGDIVVFDKYVGKILNLRYKEGAEIEYEIIVHDYWRTNTITRPQSQLLRVNNQYIVNFGNIKELQQQLDELVKQVKEVDKELNKQYDLLTNDLEVKFSKYNIFSWILKSPKKYRDVFVLHEDDE